jgi:hypothetical protein
LPCFVTKLGQQPIVLGIPWLQLHDATISWKDNTLTFASEYCRQNCGIRHRKRIRGVAPEKGTTKALDVCMIGAAAFVHLADRARKAPQSYQVFAVSLKDVERALAPKVTIDPREKLPKEYHEFLSVFSRQEADKLPPHRSYDHKIQLKEGSEPSFGPLYDMSREELQVLRKELDEGLLS